MSKLVSAARKYLGVKFRHRGRTPRGLDCVGLGILAYKDCGVALPDFRLYSDEPHQDGLVTHITNSLGEPVKKSPVRMKDLQPGDVLVLRFYIQPHHVAIVTDYKYGGLAVIHADGHSNKVLEQRLTEDMVKRVTHVFRRPV